MDLVNFNGFLALIYYKITGGLGIFTSGLLDTHFANRGRQGRLIQLLLDSRGLTAGSTVAFGIDENTALIVTGDWSDTIILILIIVIIIIINILINLCNLGNIDLHQLLDKEEF